MILTCKPSSEHDRHHLAISWVERIVDPYLKRRTPGIVTLSCPVRARRISLSGSAWRPVRKA